MKKRAIILLALCIGLGSNAWSQTAQTDLDDAIAEEASLQAQLLKIKERKKTAQERLQKQGALMKEVDQLKGELSTNSKLLKNAEAEMMKSEKDLEKIEMQVKEDKEKLQPMEQDLERKIAKRRRIEKLLDEKSEELKKLSVEINAEQKKLNKMKAATVGTSKKVDTRRSQLTKEKDRVYQLKKAGNSIQKTIEEKQKELKSLK